VASTKLLLVTGDQVEVDGPVEAVARRLEDAARSTAGTLAWLKDARTEQPVGVNPAQVALVRGEDE
jgi:hypothetical protein